MLRCSHTILDSNSSFLHAIILLLIEYFVYFSQAVLVDKTLYVSGVLGMTPDAQLVSGGIKAQTKQALDNLQHILVAGGASLQSVVKTTILLANLGDFDAFNKVYAEC